MIFKVWVLADSGAISNLLIEPGVVDLVLDIGFSLTT